MDGAFASIDVDGDGVACGADMRSTLEEAEEIQYLLGKCDANADGSICYEEFSSCWEQDLRSRPQGPSAVDPQMGRTFRTIFNSIVHSEAAMGQQQARTLPAASSGSSSTVPATAIKKLFTFGCPSTARTGLVNFASADGCFPGLRSVTKNVEEVLLWEVTAYDPVTWIAAIANYQHSHMAVVALDGEDDGTQRDCLQNNAYFPAKESIICAVANVNLHWPSTYASYLPQTAEYAEVRLALNFSNLIYANSKVSIADAAKALGWNLVAYGTFQELSISAPKVYGLFQEPETLQCMLTFQGSQLLTDWLLDFDGLFTADFCGFPDVHQGFRDFMEDLLNAGNYISDVRPKLRSCASLSVSGHSLGGAAAELFTACANRAPQKPADGYQDYQQLAWTPQTPSLLPALDPKLIRQVQRQVYAAMAVR